MSKARIEEEWRVAGEMSVNGFSHLFYLKNMTSLLFSSSFLFALILIYLVSHLYLLLEICFLTFCI